MLEGKGTAWRNWEAIVFLEKTLRARRNRWGWSLAARKSWSLRVSCRLSSNARATSTEPLPQPPKGMLSQIPGIWQLVFLEKSEVLAGFNVVLLAYQIMSPLMLRTACYLRHQRRSWNSQIKRDYYVFGKFVLSVYIWSTLSRSLEEKGGWWRCLRHQGHSGWSIRSRRWGFLVANDHASPWVNCAAGSFL